MDPAAPIVPRDAAGLRPWAVVGVLGCGAAATVAVLTRHGVGLNPDSAVFVGAARSVAGGHGVTLPLPGGGRATVTRFPPLYPVVLAGLSFLGSSTLAFARWMDVAILGATVVLTAVAVRRYTPQSLMAPVVAALVATGSLTMLRLHVVALTEPLFLLSALAGMLCLDVYAAGGRLLWLLSAAAATSVAVLTRYTGMPLVAAGACWLLLQRRSWSRRLADAVIFSVVAGVPGVAWLVLVRSSPAPGSGLGTAGLSLGRDVHPRLHLLTGGDVRTAVSTGVSWIAPSTLPTAARVAVGAATVAGLAALVIAARNASGSVAGAPEAPRPAPVWFAALIAALYLAFVVVSVSLIDAQTPLDYRILSPLLVLAVVVLVPVGHRAWAAGGRVRWAAPATVVVVLCGALWAAVAWARGPMHADLGYGDPRWRASPTVSFLRRHPALGPVISNGPDPIYLLADEPSGLVPARTVPGTAAPNGRYLSDMADVRRRLMADHGAVVWFWSIERPYLPTEPEVARRLGLVPIARLADGVVMIASPTAAP